MADGNWEERMLQDLAQAITFPETPDVRGAVAARLHERPAPAPRPGTGWRLALGGLAAVVLALLVTVVVSSDAREAVAEFLGLRVAGERIEIAPTPAPGVTPTALPGTQTAAQLGRKVTLEEARLEAGFAPLLPAGRTAQGYYVLNEDRLVLIADYGEFQVWQFPFEAAGIGKMIFVNGGTLISEVQVNGEAGYWISGGERLVTVEGPDGTPIARTSRTTGANALVWGEGGRYLRIEGAASLEYALAIAAEVR